MSKSSEEEVPGIYRLSLFCITILESSTIPANIAVFTLRQNTLSLEGLFCEFNLAKENCLLRDLF